VKTKQQNKWTINSSQGVKTLCGYLPSRWEADKYLIVTIKTASKLDIQNRWIQQFYNMVSEQSGQSRESLENHCKYTHGMPILLIDDPAQAAIWRKQMLVLTEEERRLAMKYTSVTRLFGLKEASEYIQQLINHFDHHELPRKDWDKQK